MNKFIKILIGLLSIPLIVLGVAAMFNPTMPMILEKFSVIPEAANSINGLNTIRSIVGGLLLGSGVLMLIGLFLKNSAWFMAVAVLMGIVIIGRIFGIFVDGFDPKIMPPLISEIVIGGVLILGTFKLKPEFK